MVKGQNLPLSAVIHVLQIVRHLQLRADPMGLSPEPIKPPLAMCSDPPAQISSGSTAPSGTNVTVVFRLVSCCCFRFILGPAACQGRGTILILRFKWGIPLLSCTAHHQIVNDRFYGYPGKQNLSLKARSSGLFLARLSLPVSIAVLMLARQHGHRGCDVPHMPEAGKPQLPQSESAVPRHHRGK